jgi:hypothetical protein
MDLVRAGLVGSLKESQQFEPADACGLTRVMG